jgi:hypothetical protein
MLRVIIILKDITILEVIICYYNVKSYYKLLFVIIMLRVIICYYNTRSIRE